MLAKLHTILRIIQISFTYIGTVVGAGFASGQEIVQFYTRYGNWAFFTIALATGLFIWLGTKMMLLAAHIGANSYEDVNRHLFGKKLGAMISQFMLIVLIGVTAVMLAGAGTIWQQQLHFSYQFSLVVTMVACYILLQKGMQAIMTVNTIVVPIMLAFTALMVMTIVQAYEANQWLQLSTEQSWLKIMVSPFLYSAFNLAMAQTVLVPLGTTIMNRRIIVWGSTIGGIGIGVLLIAGHIALATQMPDIENHTIPMSTIAKLLGGHVQWIYISLIFAEIFTTLMANIYGISLQLQKQFKMPMNKIALIILTVSYILSQAGFADLLATLYPLFGFISLVWLGLLIRTKTKE